MRSRKSSLEKQEMEAETELETRLQHGPKSHLEGRAEGRSTNNIAQAGL